MNLTAPIERCVAAAGLPRVALLLVLISAPIFGAQPDGEKSGDANSTQQAIAATAPNAPAELATMRPIRKPARIEISVGQGEGDLQGTDDKILQAAVDYVSRLGGGTVRVLPGTYTMRNAIFLRPGIALCGSGEKTILKRAPCISTPLVREADWYEYAVQVADAKGFTPGCGVAIRCDAPAWPQTRVYTVTAVQGNVLYLDGRTEKNYWMVDGAKVQMLSSILYGLNAPDVRIEDLVLDGNRTDNPNLNGNYGAAAFLQYCDRWSFRNVTARNFNGDGFSFQVCDDVHFDHCQSLGNADLGFHPGSGSQRPVLRHCTANGNSEGLFWCWGACDGLVEDCVFSDNAKFGMDFGHRDTDNVVRRCTFERNGQYGIVFRKEAIESRTGDRNRIEGCVIRDNGAQGQCGIDIAEKTRDIAIVGCRFENSPAGKQKTAIRIGHGAERITLEGNTFANCAVEVEDLRKP